MASEGFDGKAIAVTGGASGIGRATACRLARRGAVVIVLDADGEALRDMEADPGCGGKFLCLQVDVTDRAALADVAGRVESEFGSLYGLFNNAGVMGRPVDWTATKIDELPGMDVNLRAPYLTVRSFLDLMRAGGGGVIVNNASVTALRGSPQFPGYAAAKAGLIALSRSMAQALGRYNIRVHCICPSSVLGTAFWRNSVGRDMPHEGRMALAAHSALGRLPTPDTIASLVGHLMSPEFAAATNTLTIFDQP